VAAPVRFEVLRFSATPASAEVALLELEGRFRAPSRRRLGAPRLVAELGAQRHEVRATEGGDATAEPDGARWRAIFAVPVPVLESGSFALAVGRELLVDLPDPDGGENGAGPGDPHVRLAREANALRQRADEAREAAAAALARADDERAGRERVEAELLGARHAREELATRLAQFESELGARDEALEALRRDHAAELEGREAASQAHTDERVTEAEAESAELRRALKQARADIELLRRERDRANERASAAAAARTAPQPGPGSSQPPEDEPHPEREAARPPLPFAEGEAVGAARPAARGHATADEETTAVTGAGDDGPDDDALTTVHDGDDDLLEEPDDYDTAVARESGDTDDDATVVLGDPATAAARAERATNGSSAFDETEGVRVLGPRPPRARSGDEPPAEPLPGTAEIGARHIVAGARGRGGVAVWLARGAAILALAIVVAAVLLVLSGVR
jgi:hypothetical protein